MDKIKSRWAAHKPTQRRWIQLYAALLFNAQGKGFVNGNIYTGSLKNVCVPGINCYSCPGAIGACPLGALQNAIASSGKTFPAYVLGTIAIFGILLGRAVCGLLCPLGFIQELLYKIPVPKLKKNKYTRMLSYLKYVILVVFVIGITGYYAFQSIPVPGFCKYICPAGTLEGAIGLLSNPNNTGLLSILNIYFTRKFVILVLFIAGSMFAFRWFCRWICPLGAIYGFFNRIAMLGMTVDESKCTHCGLCVAGCKMDVKHVGDHECIQCGECAKACHQGAICRKTLLGGKKAIEEDTVPSGSLKKRAIAWSIALVVLAGVFWYTNFYEQASDTIQREEISESGNVLGYQAGHELRDFAVPVYGSDEVFRVSDCRGKVTVINFWATYCGPCCKELPDFQKVYDEYGDSINIIAIHAELVTEDVAAFLKEQGYTMPFGYDADSSAAAACNVGSLIPQTVILNADGIVVYNEISSMTYDKLVSLIVEAGG